jgi:hypothetical protein
MKTLKLKMLSLFFLMSGGLAVIGQSYQSEVPGDDFSLEGALELFKKSSSPEEFERLLNSADARVNNLDLNGDGQIDYIRVIDKNRGNVHAFILQAVISENEGQDIAVIELEKLANGKAVLQITGDEDIYGIETIIEPTEEVRINAGTMSTRTVVNVWAWPSVQYVYSPYYTVWVSPWHWRLRPVWWSSWGPVAYYDYYSYWHPYRNYYSHCHTHRVAYARDLYRPHRTTSVVVHNRHHDRVVQYRSSRQANERNYSNNSRSDKSGYANSGTRTLNTNDKQRTNSRSLSTTNNNEYKTRDEKQQYRPAVDTKSEEKQSFERREVSKSSSPTFNRSTSEKSKQQSAPRSISPQQKSSNTYQRSGSSNVSKSSAPRQIKSNGGGASSSPTFKRSDGGSNAKKKN